MRDESETKKGERKDEEAKKRNQQKSIENWLHLPFPRGSCSQDREKGRKERRKGAREGQREGQKEEGRREREQKSAYKHYFIINIPFSLSRSGLLLNFALASPQIIRLFLSVKIN